jgi:Thrombospondin type 3 repeat
MNYCTNSFCHPRSFARLTFLIAVMALPALGVYAQTQPGADPYQNISLITARPCSVGTIGEVTHLVKNGVELSVNEDWDCDGIADAYDNCVGMPNATQTDSDGNGIGDVCEAATTIKAGMPAKSRSNTKAKVAKAKALSKSKSNTKAKGRKATAANKRSPSSVKRRRNL